LFCKFKNLDCCPNALEHFIRRYITVITVVEQATAR